MSARRLVPVPTVISQAVATAHGAVRKAHALALETVGGRARGRVVLTLAAVLGLSGADAGALSVTTDNLERAFGVGNTSIGLLLSVVGLVGASFTIPAGVLTDRTRRTRLLAASILAWSVATVVSGAASSYGWMLGARVFLGAVNATTGPAIASLTGDFFPAADRGRMYGLILGGDLVGSGIGYVVSGEISSLTSWRLAFWWLAIPSLAVAYAVWRLPEPARGGQSRLEAGAERIPDQRESGAETDPPSADRGDQAAGRHGLAEHALRRTSVEPDEDLILRTDPTGRPIWWVARYVLRVRTNVVIIAASALGYFFFAGLRTFAIIYATGHYGIAKPTATALVVVVGAGAVAGIFSGGRIADRWLRRGQLRARILVPATCLLALPLVLAPAIATTSVAVALPLLICGAFLLGAPNPPLDAARLDIMHPRLWGRAEGIRTVLRSLAEAAAPALFGFVSQYVFSDPGSAGNAGGGGGAGGNTVNASGLEHTYLIFLIPLLAAGLLTLAALRTYPRDVATATASVRFINEAGTDGEPAGIWAGTTPAERRFRRSRRS